MIRALAFTAFFALTGGAAFADAADPYLYVLGVAQDAGYPQVGCYQPHCLPGWKDPSLQRGAVSLGLIDPQASRKYLFEASPDFPRQLHALEVEAPSDRFEWGGIFLTHAHIGHYTGLMYLGHEAMGASEVPVYAMPRMREFLAANGPWSQLVSYENIRLMPLNDGQVRPLGRISVTPFRVPHREEYSEVVGYRIEGPNKSALFIPDIDQWTRWVESLPEWVADADYALVDATFYGEGELPGRDMSTVPHPLVVDTMALLEHLPETERRKVWFIHMNHTNPLLDPDSEESRYVREAGFNVAKEGLRLPL